MFNIEDIITFTEEEKQTLLNNNATDTDDDPEGDKSGSDNTDNDSDDSDNSDADDQQDSSDDTDDFQNDDDDNQDDSNSNGGVDVEKLYTTLKEANSLIVPEDFEFDGSIDKLAEAFDHTYEGLKATAKESLLNSLDKQSQLALSYALMNKKPLSAFYEETNIDTVDYSNVDLEDEENQKEIVRAYLQKTTSFNNAKIENQIKILEKNGDIAVEAKEYILELVALQEQDEQAYEKELKEQEQKSKEKLAKWKQDRMEVIKSLPDVDDTRRSKLGAFVLNEVYTGKSREKSTELLQILKKINDTPSHYIQLADILMDYDAEKGINLERLSKKIATKSNVSLKDKLENNVIIPKGKDIKKKTTTEFDWDAWAKQL